MPTPRRQTIIDALKTQLQAINGTGNYNFDFSNSVYLWRFTARSPVSADDPAGLPALIIRDTVDKVESRLSGLEDHTLTVVIDVLHSSTTPDADVRKMIADVELAIGDDRTLGGEARDTLLLDDKMDVLQEGDVNAGARITAQIRHRTAQFDPYTKR